MDMVEQLCAVEHYSVHYLSACRVYKVKFDVLAVAADEFRCAEISDIPCAEDRFIVAQAEGIELFEKTEKLRSDFRECQIGVNVELRGELVGANVVADKLLEAPGEFRDILFLDRKSVV